MKQTIRLVCSIKYVHYIFDLSKFLSGFFNETSIKPNLFIVHFITSQLGKIFKFQLTSSRFCEKNRFLTFVLLMNFTAVQKRSKFHKVRFEENEKLKKWKMCVRFYAYRISGESRFGTGESWKEHLSNLFSVDEEDWFGGKCVGRECTTEITDCCFEKRRKGINL